MWVHGTQGELEAALAEHWGSIADEVQAVALNSGPPPGEPGVHPKEVTVGEAALTVGLRVVS